MKIKLVQMDILQNQVQKNLDVMIKEITSAKGKCDVIVFPELCLTSSMGMEHFENQFYIEDLLKANDEIISISEGITVIWGNVMLIKGELYNGGYVASNKEIIFKTHKRFHPSAALPITKCSFDYQQSLKDKTFILDGHICSLFINHDIRVFNHKKSEFIFHLNSHYYRQQDDTQKFFDMSLNPHQVLVSVNGVNLMNDGKHIVMNDGNSFVLKNDVKESLNSQFEAESRIIDTDHLVANEVSSDRLFQAMLAMIRKTDQQLFGFKPTWVVGASGGLDSSVTIGLLATALGTQRVLAANLRSQHNSQTTKTNASQLCSKLGVRLVNGSIEELANQTYACMDEFGFQLTENLDRENTQARLRGHLLSTLSSVVGGVVSNNTNKVESAFGYGTLYGDTIGAIGFLADCTKMDVVKLAGHLNDYYHDEIVPYNLLPTFDETGIHWDFMPSAELSNQQVDPMKWGYHDYVVNRLMKGNAQVEMLLSDYHQGILQKSEAGHYLKQYGLDNPQSFISDFWWVIKNINKNVFKRIQGAPMLVVSDCAISLDASESQEGLVLSEKAKELIKEIENA